MFRIFSQCSECSESVQIFLEFLAQKLVYSEFLDFVVSVTVITIVGNLLKRIVSVQLSTWNIVESGVKHLKPTHQLSTYL